ncbi:hypothetical protein IX51_08030 [uncultured archaeon]|nr:hypothetical protein IX51_08030 [uncultured archaeon]
MADFFPRGVTGLIIYRGLRFARKADFLELCDYLRYVGKKLSKPERSFYSQRRNRTVNYALSKLSSYNLVKWDERAKRYECKVDYEAYLKFLRETADELYQRGKRGIEHSIMKLIEDYVDRGMKDPSRNVGIYHSARSSMEPEFTQEERDLLDCNGWNKYNSIGEVYMDDLLQLDLLEKLILERGWKAQAVSVSMSEIVMDQDKERKWINEKLGLEGLRQEHLKLRASGPIRIDLEAEPEAWDILTAEGLAARRVFKLEGWDTEKAQRRYELFGDSVFHRMVTTKPWWLRTANENEDIENIYWGEKEKRSKDK